MVYLNGAYADLSHWRRVIADLGSDYRHITYDERARGKSKRSADYSFEAYIRDLDAVLQARGVDRPLLVGWSLGGILAWHWADRNPDRLTGVVCGRLPNLTVSAKVASNHTKILRKDSPAVARTVRELAAACG